MPGRARRRATGHAPPTFSKLQAPALCPREHRGRNKAAAGLGLPSPKATPRSPTPCPPARAISLPKGWAERLPWGPSPAAPGGGAHPPQAAAAGHIPGRSRGRPPAVGKVPARDSQAAPGSGACREGAGLSQGIKISPPARPNPRRCSGRGDAGCVQIRRCQAPLSPPGPQAGRGLGQREAVTVRPNKRSSRPRGGQAWTDRLEGNGAPPCRPQPPPQLAIQWGLGSTGSFHSATGLRTSLLCYMLSGFSPGSATTLTSCGRLFHVAVQVCKMRRLLVSILGVT